MSWIKEMFGTHKAIIGLLRKRPHIIRSTKSCLQSFMMKIKHGCMC